jgi:CHAD domain-containing protein
MDATVPNGFALRQGEPFGAELKRVLYGEIRQARAHLDAPVDREGAVHQARRSLKRARTLLLVLEPVLAEHYERQRDGLRDAARALAPARDADVMLGRAGWLLRHADVAHDAKAAAALLRHLERRAEAAHTEAVDTDAVAARLAAVEGDVLALPVRIDGAGLIVAGFEQVYRLGRRDWRHCDEGAPDEALHEWRKAVKHRLHLTDLLIGRSAATSPSIRKDLAELADLLGDEHDFALLGQLIDAERDLAGGKAAARGLGRIVEKRRRKLTRRALELGGELYGVKTRRFAEPIRALLAP